MKKENDENKRRGIFSEEELAVEKANQRAWDHWGAIWRFERKNRPPDPNALQLMKVRAFTYLRVYDRIAVSVGGLEGKKMLDIGCGTSEYLKWFADNCGKLVGVDISKEMLRLCREDWGKSIEVVAADALHLPFRNEAFDASMTFQALHHFPSWQKAFLEMVRTAKQVIVYEPNSDSIFHKFMDWARRTFRFEQRFKQTDEHYELVEFQAAGFSSARIMHFLETRGRGAELFTFSLVPVSMLQKFFKLSPRLMFLVLHLEDLIGKLPIIRNQLGGILVISKKTARAL